MKGAHEYPPCTGQCCQGLVLATERLTAAQEQLYALRSELQTANDNLGAARTALTETRAAALEEAAKACRSHAEKLYAFMETFPIGDTKRRDVSRRAAEWFEAEKTVRALATTPPTSEPAHPRTPVKDCP